MPFAPFLGRMFSDGALVAASAEEIRVFRPAATGLRSHSAPGFGDRVIAVLPMGTLGEFGIITESGAVLVYDS